MENSLKGLLLAAGTVITCLIVGLGFYIAKEAKNAASSGAMQLNRLNAEFMESDKIMYDGVQVSGSEVINVINKFKKSDLYVKVITKRKEGGTQYGGSSTDNSAQKGYPISMASSSDEYINPNGIFWGEIDRNGNDVIVGIIFTQH